MPKAKYILTAHDYQGPIEKALGQKDSRVGVYDDADLKRRTEPVRRDVVRDLLRAGMRETEAAERAEDRSGVVGVSR